MTTTGETIRAARAHARLSQSDLARRSGVDRRVISAYETGRREPASSTMVRLIRATGGRVVAVLVDGSRATVGE